MIHLNYQGKGEKQNLRQVRAISYSPFSKSTHLLNIITELEVVIRMSLVRGWDCRDEDRVCSEAFHAIKINEVELKFDNVEEMIRIDTYRQFETECVWKLETFCPSS